MLTRIKSHASIASASETNGPKDLPEKCRICLDDGVIPLFGANDISNDVMEFGKIEIAQDDNLPQYLCEACNSLLDAAILFRKTAKQSEEVLRRTEYLDSDTEDSDCKQEDEIVIKKEYLDLDWTDSEAEIDDFDKMKSNHESEDEFSNYYPTISDDDTQHSKDFQTDSLHIKHEEDESINEADSETVMIIVSDKDKIKLEPDEHSNIDFDNAEQTTEQSNQSLMKILPHQRECEVCHSIILKTAYREHLKVHRKKYIEKFNRRYGKIECELCGKHISKSYIKTHMKLHGTPEEQAERLVKCTYCDKMISATYYNNHVQRMHPTKSEQYKKLQRLMTKQSPPPTYHKCPVCDRNIKESDYKYHLEKHNGPLPRYVCEKCGKVFKHQSAFKTHCLIHGSELKYKCQFCPYRGLHQGLLKIHVRTHTGDYNYKCTECPARFITKSNLSKHLNRHKGLCTVKCDKCSKGFYTKRDLEKHHRNVHMTTKLHICELCGKGFGHRDNMLAHQLKVHKRQKIIAKGRMPSYLKPEFMQIE